MDKSHMIMAAYWVGSEIPEAPYWLACSLYGWLSHALLGM